MNLVIAGSRTIDEKVAFNAILRFFSCPPASLSTPLLIVSGGAQGVDHSAQLAATYLDVKFKEFPADWTKHGKAAGPLRNKQMAEFGDALLLIWDGKSRGSASMKREMERLGKPIWEIVLI